MRLLALVAILVLLLVGTLVTADAAVLAVANNGLDDAACGTKAAPCRSITRAIANAAPGDTIVVGPGRYGDLDRDGIAGEPNEEGPALFALLLVDKPVAIESSAGAATTILDGAGANQTAVRITASGARFGKAKKGFTVFDSGGAGIAIDTPAAGSTIAGNLVIAADGNGLAINSTGAGNRIDGNVSVANGTGVALGSTAGGLARGNLALASSFDGFGAGGAGQRFEGNVATGNVGFGFRVGLYSDAAIAGSVAVGNLQGFFGGNGTGFALTGVAAIANIQGGVHNQGTTNMTVTASNVIANGAKAIVGVANCGTINESNPLTATTVFWGAATGPGADPADDACDLLSGATTTDPIAVKPFKVKPKVPQL